MHIPEYSEGTWTNHAARRKRKLLLNRDEIDKIERRVKRGGRAHASSRSLCTWSTVAPRSRSRWPRAKSWDKRHALAERQADREVEQAVGRRLKGMDDEPLDGDVAPVRAFWEGLGLPGLVDVHVHFLPPNIQRAVYAQFDDAGPKIGREWPIRYRVSHDARVSLLRDMGVRRFRRCRTPTSPAWRRTSTRGRGSSPPGSRR